VEVLKQPQYQPMAVEKQIAIIFAVTNGYLDDVDVDAIRQWEQDFHQFMEAQRPDLLRAIRTQRALSDELTGQLRSAIDAFKKLGR
jgi:F-type H+-transporting ATPase subunit alpha